MTAPAAAPAEAPGEVKTSEEKSLPPAATGPGGFVILLLVLAILDLVEAGLVGMDGLVHEDAQLNLRFRS